MQGKKLHATVALLAALGAGAMVGMFLGVPGISQAGTAAPSAAAGTVEPGRAGRGPSLDVAAKALGMGTADLKAALGNGQSIAAVATSKGIDVQKVIDALVADANSRIEAAVTAGRITPAQATTLKQNLTSRITAFVNQAHRAGGHGFPGRPGNPAGAAGAASGAA